jgi:hypothetical protein
LRRKPEWLPRFSDQIEAAFHFIPLACHSKRGARAFCHQQLQTVTPLTLSAAAVKADFRKPTVPLSTTLILSAVHNATTAVGEYVFVLFAVPRNLLENASEERTIKESPPDDFAKQHERLNLLDIVYGGWIYEA